MSFSRLRIVALGLFVVTLPACFFKGAGDEEKCRLFVQLIADSPMLDALRDSATAVSNKIIKEELGLPEDYDYPFFVPKEINRLTLYYLYDFPNSSHERLFSALTPLSHAAVPWDAVITSEVHFFGEQDELVVMIDDPRGELVDLHEQAKAIAHQLNDEYRQTHQHALYNISESEQFAYKLHIGLGRIRLQSIKNHTENVAVLERIRERILEAMTKEVVALMTKMGKRLAFERMTIFQLNPKARMRGYIKDYPLIR